MLIQFMVEGQPVGKGRPRFARRGNYVQTYTPDKTKEYEKAVRQAYLKIAGRDKGFAEGIPVRVSIRMYYKIPKGVSKVKRQKMIDGEVMPMVKPDADNVVKSITDAINGIAWADDKQIVALHAIKFYSDNPRIEVSISDY